jgi:uncharacterized protein (TIGR02444 family)
MAGEADAAGSPFWRFSLGLYRKPGVAEACIGLQDECGVDVNLLLFLLWQASLSRRLHAADVTELRARTRAWNQEVIVPLRALRRELKSGSALIEGGAAEAFRTKVKGLELEAERLQQQAMFDLAPTVPGVPAGSTQDAAAANVAALEKVMDVRFPHASTRVLLAALVG